MSPFVPVPIDEGWGDQPAYDEPVIDRVTEPATALEWIAQMKADLAAKRSPR